MPSVALTSWQVDRQSRLSAVDSHCAAVAVEDPLDASFLDESLRGYVLHLSAHFQGFLRDLYTECTQACVAAMPIGLQAAAQAQFSKHLALERGNPSYANIRTDFERFGNVIDLRPRDSRLAKLLENLAHLNVWRNRAAHQGIRPLTAPVPAELDLSVVREWSSSCDTLATAIDRFMYGELLRICASPPWEPTEEDA